MRKWIIAAFMIRGTRRLCEHRHRGCRPGRGQGRAAATAPASRRPAPRPSGTTTARDRRRQRRRRRAGAAAPPGQPRSRIRRTSCRSAASTSTSTSSRSRTSTSRSSRRTPSTCRPTAARARSLQGNTDERGTREYNIALGQKRADAVKNLMLLLGATEIQIETVSFGKEKPRREGHDEAVVGREPPRRHRLRRRIGDRAGRRRGASRIEERREAAV